MLSRSDGTETELTGSGAANRSVVRWLWPDCLDANCRAPGFWAGRPVKDFRCRSSRLSAPSAEDRPMGQHREDPGSHGGRCTARVQIAGSAPDRPAARAHGPVAAGLPKSHPPDSAEGFPRHLPPKLTCRDVTFGGTWPEIFAVMHSGANPLCDKLDARGRVTRSSRVPSWPSRRSRSWSCG